MTCDDMMTRGRGRGVSIPPKSDDVIYEQPLKVLVARKVIRERMDYESYLGGRVKEELDGLAGLAGWYVVEDAKLEVFDLENGDELSKEAWKTPERY